jgi:two-component system, NtrC family, response regulator HydG
VNGRILLVDDEQDVCDLLSGLLRSEGAEVDSALDEVEAAEHLSGRLYDVVLTDLQLGFGSGLAICDLVGRMQPGVPVIVVTGHGSLDAAVGAIRAGAYDFITKPIDTAMVVVAVERAIQYRRVHVQLRELEGRLREQAAPGKLVGECVAMKRVYDLIQRVRDTPVSVLICGESGTGKELVAQALHEGTVRGDKRFVALNCAAVPANLLEDELFGHARGAFTDARTARTGLFEQAQGGTLFFDEIGDMPPEMQPKLLRVLQERVIRPIGDSREIPVDVRIVAATHRDLEAEVEKGTFREDLYYRLNVVQINVPALRTRGNDILILATHFIQRLGERVGRDVKGLTSEAAHLLLNYDWPGNVRQLQNCIERAVTLTETDHIKPVDLPEKIRGFRPPARVEGSDLHPEHVLTLDEVERRYIEQVLALSADNKSQAARLLGLDRRTLYRKLERYEQGGSEPPPSRE